MEDTLRFITLPSSTCHLYTSDAADDGESVKLGVEWTIKNKICSQLTILFLALA